MDALKLSRLDYFSSLAKKIGVYYSTDSKIKISYMKKKENLIAIFY